MHIRDILQRGTTFSFEFFPPKTEKAAGELFVEIQQLAGLKPAFVSVTYGAGGSTRELTHDLVVKLRTTTELDPVPHLTCVGHTREEVAQILDRYAQAGVSNIMALRGDVPKDFGAGSPWKDFTYASDLVRFIKSHKGPSGPSGHAGHAEARGFGITVAGFPEGHPETPNRLLELDRLKAKVDAGADAIVTQLFFDNRDFYDFRARCELAGIRVPIIAGIMPVTSLPGMKRMAELALGARFPAPMMRMLNRTGGSDDAVRRVGVHWATEQARDLLEHDVAGIHFYTLNRSGATREVFATLGVRDSLGLAK
jgi:methylenetetrahydrofolate reductase (NADPH)